MCVCHSRRFVSSLGFSEPSLRAPLHSGYLIFVSGDISSRISDEVDADPRREIRSLGEFVKLRLLYDSTLRKLRNIVRSDADDNHVPTSCAFGLFPTPLLLSTRA